LKSRKKIINLSLKIFQEKEEKFFSLNTEWPHLHRQVVILTRRTKKLLLLFFVCLSQKPFALFFIKVIQKCLWNYFKTNITGYTHNSWSASVFNPLKSMIWKRSN
jgi:hypothetical protein